MQPRIPKLPGWALAANKKRVSLLHRTATTPYPCFGQDLGDFGGAGRVGLTRLQSYDFFLNPQKYFSQIFSCDIR